MSYNSPFKHEHMFAFLRHKLYYYYTKVLGVEMGMNKEKADKPQELGVLDLIIYIRIDDIIYTHNELKILYDIFKSKEDEN